ncbi:peptide deformylase [Pantoea sp. Mhis]|uniref:peptide deformylase n=1 Tax=Pantoea sp. Mhis TaxID=2576759 RepID=UPI00135A272F|nr:peptide deformylase [Pantoea sp. Mhis]MXP56574.1 peptide deformylase [Pantoea sp. Mhis]
MSVLKILHFPDNRLRKIASPVITINDDIRHIVNNMFETMYHQNGIGLAATQVDIHQRIIVIDIADKQMVLINPEMQKKSGEISIEEGCLSIPEQRAFVPRTEWIKVYAQNLDGKIVEFETNNLLSICIQHEIDHLNGKLFIDYLSPLKRQRIRNKLKKLLKQNIIC